MGTCCWHSSRSAFGQLTGNNVLFFSVPPPTLFLLCRDLFSQKECSDQKTLSSESWQERPKTKGVDTFPDPVGNFGFCRQCGIAGGEWLPLVPLAWYFAEIIFDVYLGLYRVKSHLISIPDSRLFSKTSQTQKESQKDLLRMPRAFLMSKVT